jgi:hypothetical protein
MVLPTATRHNCFCGGIKGEAAKIDATSSALDKSKGNYGVVTLSLAWRRQQSKHQPKSAVPQKPSLWRAVAGNRMRLIWLIRLILEINSFLGRECIQFMSQTSAIL